MRKFLYILILLTITSPITISGQETNPKQTHIWSISLSFAETWTGYFYQLSRDKRNDYYFKGIKEDNFPKGAILRIDYKLDDNFGINSGINFKKTNASIILPLGADKLYYENSTDTEYLFEIPIQISYHLLTAPKLIDPYVNIGLRNSYFKRDYVGEYTEYAGITTIKGKINHQDGKFIMFYNLGAGTYVTISKSISLTIESNIACTISGFGYTELLGGLRYSFK